MRILAIEGVRIAGVEAEIPPKQVEALEAIRALYGDKAEGVVQATGVKTLRYAEGESAIDLCLKAAERLITRMAVAKSDIGAVVFVSFTTPRRMPAAACEAGAWLGLEKSIIAFDVNLACSGWGYGLYLAGMLAKATGKKALLLAGDVQSPLIAKGDKSTTPVLADAGSATLVEQGEDTWRFAFRCDGEKGGALELPCGGTIKMDGFEVFKFVAGDVKSFIEEFIGETDDKFDAFVPHQANVYMVRELAKALKIGSGKLAVSADRLGNSASATIPVTIAANGIKGDVLVAGFGGGLSAFAARINV